MNAVGLLKILLVEDNPADIRLTQEVMKEAKILNELNVVTDGEEALAYLHGEDGYEEAKRPDLIFLDLNLPKKNGIEVLKHIKEDPHLKRIPVVVLTISESEEDVSKSYELHANCFITKPVDLEQFVAVVRSVEEFWLKIVKLPPSEV